MPKILNQKFISNILSGVATLLFAVSTSASSIYPVSVKNVYMGGQIGWGSVHQPRLNGIPYTDIDTALTGRIFAGYQFIDYAAVEMGYTRFGNMNVSATASAPYLVNGTVQSYSIDAVVKGIWVLQPRFSLYGKLGVAFLNEYQELTLTLPGIATAEGANTERKILPTFSVGMNYDFIKHLSGDISWMHIQAVGNTVLQNTDFVALGLTYHIG